MTPAAGRLGVDRIDALVAAVLVVLGLVQVTVWPIAPSVVGQAYVLGTTLPLAWRRTRPVAASLASTVWWLVPTEGYPVLGFVAVVLQFFALGSRGEPRRLVAAVTAWAVVATAAGTLLGPEPRVAAVGAALAVVGPVLAGQVVAHLHAQNVELARLARQLEQERRRAEAAAVEVERARIAQELHDVVGHEVTLIAVQAEAASAALRVAPERAGPPVEAIRQTAHRTLAEIRGVLGILSADNAVGEAVEDVEKLTRRARDAGIDNVLTVSGSPDDRQEQARLAINRIVRECLTNAGRHANGRTLHIAVEWRPDRVLLCAHNQTDGDAAVVAGRGLTGMRHRAQLLGGTFDARAEQGRFDVRVELPLGPPTAAVVPR